MRIHTFAKRIDKQQIFTTGMFNAQEIKELERLGYRRVHVEKIDMRDPVTPENKNGIPVQGKRRKSHDHEKRDTFRGAGRTSRAR